MKMHAIPGIAAAVVLPLLVSPVKAAGVGDYERAKNVVFRCETGTKQILITKSGSNLKYEFGVAGHPEMTVLANTANGRVRQTHNEGAHSELKQLRFSNNDYSYAVFNDWASPGYDKKGGRDSSGLKVFKGTKRIALLSCKTGGEFLDQFPFDDYPEDMPEFQ